jgi:hypothetical protein
MRPIVNKGRTALAVIPHAHRLHLYSPLTLWGSKINNNDNDDFIVTHNNRFIIATCATGDPWANTFYLINSVVAKPFTLSEWLSSASLTVVPVT